MIGEWVAMRRASSASKRVSFGSTVLIPCFPTDDTSNSDDDGSLDPDDLFGNDDGSEDEGSITLEELVQASEHSFCALNGAGDDDIARRMPLKLSRKLSKSRIGSLSLPLSELHDSTDVTYSESETDVAENSSGDQDDNDEVVLLRRLDASLSPRRMKELLGSSLASKFAMSLRTLGRGDEDVDDVSQLTLDVLAGGDRSDNLFVADGEFDPSDPNWLHSSRSSAIARPSSTITPETIQAAKRKMALRAAQKAARDVGSSSSVLR